MIRYLAVAAAAKGFSLTPETLRLYRRLGNRVEVKRRLRSGLPDEYVERAIALIACARDGLGVQSGERVLEVGTGWVHWETTVLALLTDIRGTMFDVVDNRLFPVYQAYARALRPNLDLLGLPESSYPRATNVLDLIASAHGFDEAYAELGLSYVVSPEGSMDDLADASFDLVVSANVLEQVDRRIVREAIDHTYRVLRPGGHAVHQIDIYDQLSYFDPHAHAKYYYHVDSAVWEKWFNSSVQYLNRMQRPEWLDLFERAGFEVVCETAIRRPLGPLRIAPDYLHFDRTDLEVGLLRVVLRKPV